MIFGLCNTSTKKEDAEEAISRGYDFRFGYTSGYSAKENNPPAEEILRGQEALLKERLLADEKRFVPTVSCFWDPTPRHSQRWRDLGYKFHLSKNWYLQPEEFREEIRQVKRITEKLPDGAWGKRMIMVDNWNEWDEGHFVAPSLQFGFKYLQAIREELTKRDNLPDYRTPQDMGFTGYNKSWKEPKSAEGDKA